MAYKNTLVDNTKVFSQEDLDTMASEFLNVLRSVDRPGMDTLIEYIDKKTDFRTAPASTDYHGNFEGGGLVHYINAYNCFDELCDRYNIMLSPDSRKIIGLLHDFCKFNLYKKTTRRHFVEEQNKWIDYVTYQFKGDEMPLGHGEKSVMLLQQFIKLSRLEMLAIRWHMGAYEEGALRNGLNNASEYHPCVRAMQIADQMATAFYDRKIDQKKLVTKKVNIGSKDIETL